MYRSVSDNSGCTCTHRHVSECVVEPQDMAPDIEMLRGMAIQYDTGSQTMLKLFHVHQLPADPAARFRAVFQEQPQWTLQALQPYIEDLQACLGPCTADTFRHPCAYAVSAMLVTVSMAPA